MVPAARTALASRRYRGSGSGPRPDGSNRGGARSGGPCPDGSNRSGSGRPTGGGAKAGRPGGDARRRNDDRRQERPLTTAERRALEVKMRRVPRTPRDPDLERQKIADRTLETWIDDGSVRDEARHAASRASTVTAESPPKRRPPKPLDPEVAAELSDAVGKQRGERLAERLAQASEALDRERFQEARRIAGAIVKEAPDVAAAHEVHGLASYRLGMFKPAVRSLEAAFDLHPDPFDHAGHRRLLPGARPLVVGRSRLARDPRDVAVAGGARRGAHRRRRRTRRSGRPARRPRA